MSDDSYQLFHNPKIDEHKDPHKYIETMDHLREWPLMTTQKKRSIDELRLNRGDTALDMGCGTGEEVITIANAVGEKGRCVGIDLSETMLEEARQRAKGVALPIEFYKGDIYDIQFDYETFDASRAERVFEHLERPREALSELIRVTKRSGRIVAISPDVDSHAFDFPDRTLARKLIHYSCEERVNGWAGRQLLIMFARAGLTEVSCQVFTHTFSDAAGMCSHVEKTARNAKEHGAISSSELEQILAYSKEIKKQNIAFYATSHFLVAGTKN